MPDRAVEADAAWNEPLGLTARGTLIVLAGRGESPGVYERFGRRLSADAYRVRVVAGTAADPATARRQALALLGDDALPQPKILVGTDAGAILALAIAAATPSQVAGVVVAGLPTGGRPGVGLRVGVGVGEEPELRSACPVHRTVLENPALIEPGALAVALPGALRLPVSVGVPVLAVHGGDDGVSPVDDAVAYLSTLDGAHILVAEGGRHDILNDVSHRSVAAAIVLFLERVKLGASLPQVLARAGTRELIGAAR